MAYKRILTIQDISCLGQCSMTVAHPILSACGHETCMLPTALLSTHTGGFGKPAILHLDPILTDIWRHWQSCGITFDAILIGYLGSSAAIGTAMAVIDALLAPGGIVLVDPAMADHGKLYSGFDESYVREMKLLCQKAHIILPNITEAAMLSGSEYRETLDYCYVNHILDSVIHPCVVLTGVGCGEGKTGVILKDGDQRHYYPQEKVGASYHGTGDMFAACFTGALMQGFSSFESVKIAADFTKKCIEYTFSSPVHWYGIQFERILPELSNLMQSK